MTKRFLHNDFIIEQLESRLLFSADAGLLPIDAFLPHDEGMVDFSAVEAALVPGIGSTDLQVDAEHERHEILFVDSNVSDYEQLVDDILANGNDGLQIDVVVLDSSRDGIDQISETLNMYEDIDAVHIISHGTDGAVQLGNAVLNLDTVGEYAESIAGWQNAFSNNADLLFYGCDLAAGEDGKLLIDNLNTLTGADVAASDDLTGNALLGGDWDFEYTTGLIETSAAVSPEARHDWSGLLPSVDVSGTVYTDEGTTSAGAGLTVRLLVNGTDFGTDVTAADGSYSITGTANAGDDVLVFIDNHGTYQGNTVTESDGTNLAGLDIYNGHVITRHDNSGALSDADMDNALGGSSDTDILYSGSASNINIANDVDLYVPIGHSLTPLGDIFTQGTDGHLDLHGTYTFTATDNLTVSGDLNISADGRMDASGTVSGVLTVSGNWNDHIGTTNFISVADLQLEYNFDGISQSISSDESYYYTHFTGDSTLINSDITIANELRIEPGASLTQNATTITMNGNNYFVFGTYTHDSSSVLEVNGSISLASNKNYPNIKINNGGSVTSGNPSTIDYDLTIESGGSLNVVNRLNVGGDWINNGGTLNTSGIVAFIGSSSQIGGTAATNFDQLIIGDGAGDSVTTLIDSTSDGNMSITGGASFTVTDGINFTNSGNLTVDGTMNLGGTSTWYIKDNSTVQVNSGGLLNVQGTDDANRVTITHSAGTGFYDMLIDGGLDFNFVNVYYSKSAYQANTGFQIRSPGVETMSFDNVSFNYTEDTNGAVMLTYDTARALNAINISFDSSTYTTTSDYNVEARSGTITINGYSGNYAGEADDYDNGGTVIWNTFTTIGDGTAPVDRNVWAGGYQFGVNSFTLSTDAGVDNLTDLVVTFSGDDVNDVRTTGVGGVSIWRDDGLTPDQWDINDTQIGSTVSFIGNTASFSGLGESINTTATQYLVTYNIDGNATAGNTLQGAVTAATVSNTLVNSDTVDATLTVEAGYVHETSVYKFVYGPGSGQELYLKNSSSPTTNILNGMSIGSLYSGGPQSLLITFDPDATVTSVVNNSTVEQVQMSGRLMDSAGNSYGTVTADMTFYEDRVVFDMNVSVTSNPSGADWLFMSYATFSGAMDSNFLYSGNSNPFANQTASYTSSGQSEPISYQTLFELGATDGLVNATLQHDGSFASAGLKNIDNTGSYDVAFQKDISGAPIGNYNSSVMYSFATTTTGLDATLAEERRDGYFVPATLDFTIPGNDGINLGYVPERGAYTLQDDDDAGEDDHVQFEFQPTTIHHAPVFEISNWDTLVPSIITVDGVTKILGTDYTAALDGTTLYLHYLGDVSANSVFEIGNDFVSGTLYSDEGVTEIAGKTVRLLVNGVDAGSSVTEANGRFSIFTNIFANDTLLVYVDDNLAGTDGTTVSVNNGNGLADMDIYVDHLITRHDNSGAMTNAILNTAKGGSPDTEIIYSLDGSNNLTVSGANSELYVLTGHTFTPGADVATNDIEILGTVNGGANTFTVSGNWDSATGTFTYDTSTVIFNAAATGNTITSGSAEFYDINFNSATGDWTLLDAITANNNFTITDTDTTGNGVDFNNQAVNVTGDFTILAGGVTAGTSTITVGGNWDSSGEEIQYAYWNSSVVLTGTGTVKQRTAGGGWNYLFGSVSLGAAGQTTTLTSSNLWTANQFTIGSGTFTDGPNSYTVYLQGVGDVFIDGGGTITVQNLYYRSNSSRGDLNVVGRDYTGIGTLGFYGVGGAPGDNINNMQGNIIANNIRIWENSSTGNLNVINTNDFSITATSLTIGLNGDPTEYGYINAGASNIDINGNVIIYASDASGTNGINAGSSTWTVSGNWTNNDTFTPGTSTVTFDGGNQSINGSTTFYNFTKVDSTNNATDVTLTFDNTATQTINGILTLDGLDADDRINLVSDSPTNQWSINLTASATKGTMDYLDVTDSDASGSDASHITYDPANSIDSGNNIDWFDITAPVVTVNVLSTNDTTPELTGTVDDPAATIQVTVNGNNYAATNNGDGTWTLADNTIAPALADGVWEVAVTATDPFSNVGSDATANELTVDTTAPTVTVNLLTTNDATPQLTGTVNDTAATIQVTVNGNNYAATNNGDGTWTLADNTIAPALADGVWEVAVTATDGVGNLGSDATANELTVDTTAPTVTVNLLTTNDATPQLTGTVNDTTATIQVTVNGNNYAATNNGDGTWTLADNTIAPALADGVWEVAVTATDAASNVGTDATANELTVDTTAPTVTVNLLTTNDATPQLTGTVNDTTATIQVTVNGNNYAATNNGDGTWTLADNTIAPALADGVWEVAVTATDAASNVGADATANELTVDTTAPTVTVNLLTTNDATPQLTGTVNDTAATIQVTVNGNNYAATNNGDGTWTLADNTIAPALADGVWEVAVIATDAASNVGSDATANELTVDTTAPTVTVNLLTTGDSTPALTGTVNDPAATIQVTVNGNNYAATNNGDGTWTLADNTIAPALADGVWEVAVTATDAASNIGADATANELTVDTTAPTVTVNLLTTGDSTPELTGTVNDTAATIQVTVNGNNYAATNNGDGTWTLADNTIAPALADGVWEVAVTATDAASNVGSDATANELTVDTTAPTVTVNLLTTGDSTPELTGTVNDTAATIQVTVNGNNYAATNNGDGTWTLADNTIAPALADGVWEVVVTATDAASNVGTDATANELTVDTTAPTVTVNLLTTNDTTPQLTGTVNDTAATIQVTVNGNNYAATNNGDGTWTLADNTIAPALADGVWEIAVTATDAASNVGADATANELTVDTTAPTVTVNLLTTGDSTPELTGTVNDTSATIQVTVNGNNYAATNNGDGTWTLADNTIAPALAEGVWEVAVTATDGVGNVGADATANELTVDTTAPTVTVNLLTTNDATPQLTGTVNDTAATIQVTVNGNNYAATNNGDGTWTLADNTIAPALADGVWEVAVTATDAASNVGSDATANELTVDTTAPTVTVNLLTTGDSTPQLTGTVNDPAATIQVTVNGNNYAATNNGDGTWTLADNTIAPALADGVWEVAVTATDAASNVGADATANELTVDTTAPTVTVNLLTTNDATPQLTGTINDTAATIQVTVNGNNYAATNNGDGTWTLADNTIAPALADGVWEVAVTATDAASNVGADATANELTVDTTAPTVTVNLLTTNDATPQLTGTVNDTAATIQVTVNGNNYAATNNGDGTWTLADNTIAPALADGVWEVAVTATDAASNVGADATANELTVDTTAPTVTVNLLTTNDATPQLTGTINDTAATIQVTVNGNNYAATNNGDGTWTLADNTIAPALADGVWEVAVTATDAASNVGADATANELTVDTTAPTVTVNLLTTNDATPQLTGTINDTAATIQVTVNGNNYAATNNGDGTWTLADNTIAPALADGVWEVAVTATDAASNVGADATANELTVDTTAPTVTVNLLTTNDATPQLTGTVNDTAATIQVTVNGNNYAATNNGDGTWTLADNTIAPALADGVWEVAVTATDAASNVGADATANELTVDTTAPTVTVNLLTTNDTTPQLTGTVNDTAATIQVTVNGNNYAATNNGDGTWTLADNTIAPALADGVWEVAVTATDAASNVGADATANELTVDTTAPTVTVNLLTTNDATPQLTGTVNDTTATIQVTVNGNNYAATNNGDGTWTLADNTIAPALADGVWEVAVTATDAASNVGSDATANELTVDTTAPTVTVNLLTTNDATPQLTGTVNDTAATIQVTVNGNNYAATNNGDGTWTLADNTIAPALADGVWEVAVTATDAASNVGSDATANELTVDTTAPTVTVNLLTTNDATPQLTGTVNDTAATIQVTVNGNNYAATNNGDGTWTLADNTIAPALADGVWEVAVTATDAASNVGSDATANELTVAINDAPTATNMNAPEIYIVDTPLNLSSIVVSDVDSANVTVTLTLSDIAAGSLSTATSGAVTSTFVGGVWTASGAIADVNTLLASVTFSPALNYNSNFTIATSVSDGIAPAITGVKNIIISGAGGGTTEDPPPIDEVDDENIDENIVDEPENENNLQEEEPAPPNPQPLMSVRNKSVSQTKPDAASASSQAIENRDDYGAMHSQETDAAQLKDHALTKIIKDTIQNLIQYKQELLTSMEMTRDSIDSIERKSHLITKTIVGGTLTLSVGLATWVLRAGSLLTSAISTMPLWKGFDPLPVLPLSKKERRKKIKDIQAKEKEDSIHDKEVSEMLDSGKMQNMNNGKEEDES